MAQLQICLSEFKTKPGNSLGILSFGNIPKESYQLLPKNRLPQNGAIHMTRLWVTRFGYFNNSFLPQSGNDDNNRIGWHFRCKRPLEKQRSFSTSHYLTHLPSKEVVAPSR
jgi:hypothetical protein